MKKLLLNATFFLLLVTINVKAQDIHFSQFTMTPLQIDPSQAGKISGDQRAILNYRNQWSSVASPFKTYGFSFDCRLSKKDNFFGGGISVYSDKAGDINMGYFSLNVPLAFHFSTGANSYLSGGIQGGFLQRSIDVSKLRYDNQYDGSGHNASYSSNEVINNPSFFEPDFAAGVSYSYGDNTSSDVINNNGYSGKKLNVGLAVHHVASPNYSFLSDKSDKLKLKYVLHGVGSMGIPNTSLAVQPSGFVQYQQGATNIVIGSYFRYTLKERSKYTGAFKGTAISLGTHYRTGDAFITSTLIETGSLALGLSYDLNLSGLKVASNGKGGFEISLRYINPNPFSARKSQARFF